MLRFAHHNPQTHLRKLAFSSSNFAFLHMGSKFLLKPSTLPSLSPPPPFSSTRHPYHTFKRLLPVICSKPISKIRPYLPKPNGFSSHATIPAPVYRGDEDLKTLNYLKILKGKLEQVGIVMDEFAPGQHNHLRCPMCNGGGSEEKTFSLFINPDGSGATWNCFRGKCGWSGGTRPFAGRKSTYESSIQENKIKKLIEITEKSLELEPLCGELTGYFAERLITKETLERNRVMQRSYGNQIVIAFTYWRNGVLTSCKYRDANKRFWQEKDTEKIFYGLDDIKEADDVIIVEGEMDKLAMEEAGFRNCVSVPDGAPASVSSKELPSEDKLGHKISISLELQRVLEEGISHNTCY